jgi:hypothetical protein
MVLSLEPFASPARLEALAALQASLIPIPLIETTVPDLEVLPRQNAASEQFLFVTNLNAREARQGDIRVRGRFAAVTELSGDARPQVPARPMGAATVLPIRLAPGGAVFLRLGRPE